MTTLRIDLRIVTPSGKVKWIALTSRPMSQDANGLITWNGVMADITTEKLLSDDLRAAKQRFTRMAETLPYGLYDYVIHADGRTEYLYLSKRAEEVYEYTHAELKANMSLFWDMVDPDDLARLREADVEANQSGRLFISEFRITTRSGQRKWIRLTSSPDHAQNSLPVVWSGVVADITEEKVAEQARLQHEIDQKVARERLIRLEEADRLNARLTGLIEEKNQLLRSLSLFSKSSTASNLVSALVHEVNQPLGAIEINSEHLQSLLGTGAAEPDLQDARRLLMSIRSDNMRAADIISCLRKMFTRESAWSETISINDLVTTTAEALGFEFKRQNIAVTMDLDPSGPGVSGERGQLQMVIFNALNNAVDALRSQQGARAIGIRTHRTGDFATIDVQDNGPGFTEHILHNGFQLFHTTKPDGMGVGLWLSRAIVEHHGGSMSALNGPSGGARLAFILPCSASGEPPRDCQRPLVPV